MHCFRGVFIAVFLCCILAVAATADDPFPKGKLKPEDEARVAELQSKILAGEYTKIHGILAIRDGKIFVEEYANGQDANSPTDIRSASKSITALLIGIAIDQGKLKGVDVPIFDFLPEFRKEEGYDSRKDRITIGDIMRMSSGLDCFDFDMESPGNEENMYPKEDWLRFFADIPVAREPGEAWRYCTTGVFALSAVLQRSTGVSPVNYAAEYLLGPLGISRDVTWPMSPKGLPMTGGGMEMTARELARVGQMVLDGGRWQGKQIVSEAWVREMIRPVVTTTDGRGYGYLWWHNTFYIDGRAMQTSYMSGNGGNKVYVFPEERIVVVFTSSFYGNMRGHQEKEDILVRYLLPALLHPEEKYLAQEVIRAENRRFVLIRNFIEQRYW